MHPLRVPVPVPVPALAAALATLLSVAGPAVAFSDDEAERHGGCSHSSEWRVEAKADDGRIEVEAEVDGGRKGTWSWRLLHNDSLSARGTTRTDGSSGFEVRREMTDLDGVDRFSFRARNQRTGEWCRGPVAL